MTVIGTEISDTAEQFPNTVRHDFHEPRAEWLGKASFVYSNSWDHAYDPAKALRTWMGSLKPHGIAILEHTIGHRPENTGESDPFGASLEELLEFVNAVGAGRFSVSETLAEFDFAVPAHYGALRYVVIGNDLLATNRVSRSETLEPDSKTAKPPIGADWTFSVGGNSIRFLRSGWSEPDRYGCWTIGRHAALDIPVEPTGCALQVKMSGYAFIPPDVGLQRIHVSLNGMDLTRVEFTSGSRKAFEFWIPASAVLRTGNLLTLTIERPGSPASFGISTDTRQLGFHLASMSFWAEDLRIRVKTIVSIDEFRLRPQLGHLPTANWGGWTSIDRDPELDLFATPLRISTRKKFMNLTSYFFPTLTKKLGYSSILAQTWGSLPYHSEM